jgi:hypothetical protein
MLRISFSLLPVRSPICLSEKPMRLALRRVSARRVLRSAYSRVMTLSNSTSCRRFSRNQMSIPVSRQISSGVSPRVRACQILRMRSGVPERRSSMRAERLILPMAALSRAWKPDQPFSSERRVLLSASLNVRPMPMASPTDFICEVSRWSLPGNFSKSQRGTLTTT